MDALTAVYFVAFVAGIALAIAGWLLGHHATGHHGGGHHAHVGGDLRWFTPLINLTALSALACVGGGVGLFLKRLGVPSVLTLVCALGSGLGAAYAIGAFAAWLARGTRYMSPLPPAIVGTVISKVGPGTGEIVYLQNGARASLPAQSATGESIEPGSEVVVVEIRDGIARVERAAQLLDKED